MTKTVRNLTDKLKHGPAFSRACICAGDSSRSFETIGGAANDWISIAVVVGSVSSLGGGLGAAVAGRAVLVEPKLLIAVRWLATLDASSPPSGAATTGRWLMVFG